LRREERLIVSSNEKEGIPGENKEEEKKKRGEEGERKEKMRENGRRSYSDRESDYY